MGFSIIRNVFRPLQSSTLYEPLLTKPEHPAPEGSEGSEGSETQGNSLEFNIQAAKNGDPEACYLVGKHYHKEARNAQPVRFFATTKQLESDRATGNDYSRTAAHYLEKAAEQNHPEATHMLGFIKLRGSVTSKHPGEGLQLINKAAELGSTTAMNFIGDSHLNDWYGMPKDTSKASYYFSMSAAKGDEYGIKGLEESIKKSKNTKP